MGWRVGYQRSMDQRLLAVAMSDRHEPGNIGNSSGGAEGIQDLLKRGAHVDATDDRGDTALTWEVYNKNSEMVRVLLERGANPNPKGFLSEGNLLTRPLSEGDWDIAGMLVSYGADPNTTGRWGRTPLMQASQSGNIESIQDLIHHGANVNAQGEGGSTALMMAARMGDSGAVAALLQAGADTGIRNESGKTALMIARKTRQLSFAVQRKYLVRNGFMDYSHPRQLQRAKRAAQKDRDSIVLALKRSGSPE